MGKKLMIDLFSGLGGASEPFIQDPEWEVLRFDNAKQFKDIFPETFWVDLSLPESISKIKKIISSQVPSLVDIDLLWASPPCTLFSTANNVNRDVDEAMKLVHQTHKIIKALKPKIWVLENVHGSIKPISKHYGPVRQIVGRPFYGSGGFSLWGNFPLLDMPHNFVADKKSEEGSSDDKLRGWKRSIVPPEIGEALKRALRTQTRIDDWNDMVSERSMP